VEIPVSEGPLGGKADREGDGDAGEEEEESIEIVYIDPLCSYANI
jgi:hypothetical protein